MVSQCQTIEKLWAGTNLHRQTDRQIPIYPPELRSRGYNKNCISFTHFLAENVSKGDRAKTLLTRHGGIHV